MEKVLLINPRGEFKTPIMPHGLALIGAYLKSKNIEVSAIDAGAEDLDIKTLENRVFQSGADIIGIYMASTYYDKAKSAIEVCRRALPNSIIIAGGPHSSALPVETLNEIPELDICVVGEGEITMYEIVKSLQENSELSMVDGIVFRNNKEIISTKPRDLIKDLDIVPFPDRDLFPHDKYKGMPLFIREKPSFVVITSRGCPYQCAYCSKDVFRDTYRGRSFKNVCDEIEELISKYGAKEIQFYDDEFTMNRKRTMDLCDEMIRRNFKIRWSCIARVDLVDEELLLKMKQAGCWLIAYGVESGNQEILDNIKKGYTIKQVISSFEMTRKIGIKILAYFMVGLPGETEETYQETIKLSKKIKPNFAVWSVLVVYPGSRLFKLINQRKYSGKLIDLGKEGKLSGTFYGKGNFIVFEDNLPIERLKELSKKANQGFYLRPAYVIQSLKSIRSLSDIIYYLRGALRVIESFIG